MEENWQIILKSVIKDMSLTKHAARKTLKMSLNVFSFSVGLFSAVSQ